MKIQAIFGLGNPGEKYQDTRHNAGFWYVDALAKAYNCVFKTEKKFKAEVGFINHMGQKIWLVKPQTFMNCSGQTVIPFVHFYRIPVEEVLVAYDELDLPVGTAKLKRNGGHGSPAVDLETRGNQPVARIRAGHCLEGVG